MGATRVGRFLLTMSWLAKPCGHASILRGGWSFRLTRGSFCSGRWVEICGGGGMKVSGGGSDTRGGEVRSFQSVFDFPSEYDIDELYGIVLV